MKNEPVRTNVLSVKMIPNANPMLRESLKLLPGEYSLGLITTDCDDVSYTALDEATKKADVRVAYARSMYAGASNASTKLAGEFIGILAGPDPAEVRSGLDAAIAFMERDACFYSADQDDSIVYFAHCISRTGSFLSAEAGVRYEGGSWKTRGEKDLSFEASYSGEVRAGVEPTVVLNFCEIDVVDASVEVGGAIRGELLPRENGMLCCDLNAWMYVDLGVGQHDSALAKLGLRKVFHIVDEGNSPKWSVHTEDGKVVPECTWNEEPEVPAGYKLLEKMPTTFVYSTGTWYNALYLQKDGAFDGILVDLNVGMTGEGYPNGSITLGEYYGGFEPPTQEGAHEYRFEYKSLSNVRQPGTEQIVNGVRYYFTEPVGLTGGAITLLIYTPGATLSELPWGAEDWARYEGAFDSSGRLASYILYNPVQGTAFIGRPQWTDSIADIKAQNGIPF